jgi:hypothetical protein
MDAGGETQNGKGNDAGGVLPHRDIIGVFHGLNEESFRRRN